MGEVAFQPPLHCRRLSPSVGDEELLRLN